MNLKLWVKQSSFLTSTSLPSSLMKGPTTTFSAAADVFFLVMGMHLIFPLLLPLCLPLWALGKGFPGFLANR